MDVLYDLYSDLLDQCQKILKRIKKASLRNMLVLTLVLCTEFYWYKSCIRCNIMENKARYSPQQLPHCRSTVQSCYTTYT